MLQGIYNQIKRAHVAGVMAARPKMEDGSSGMGDAESKRGVKQKFRPTAPTQIPTIKDVKTMDDTIYMGKGAQVHTDDFPKSWYMGEEDTGGI